MTTRPFHLKTRGPARDTLAVVAEEESIDPLFGATTRKRLHNLRHLYEPSFPATFTVGDDASRFEAAELKHPIDLVLLEGPRPDAKHCLQRIRSLWLLAENRGGQLDNDPVLAMRHQAALVDFLSRGDSPRRVLVADEVGLGKTVETGLLIRQLLHRNRELRVLYLTLGGLVENVLTEFDRLDLPRWSYFGNVSEDAKRHLTATPLLGITDDNRLVVASIHKLCASGQFEEQRRHLGDARFDVIIVDECHTLRAYGPAADSQQVWFRAVRSLLEHHLTEDGRVLFLSATPHQGHREVFLNLIALCTGIPLSASEAEKAGAAHGKVIFRIKEHVRDWEGKRIFPARDVRVPILVTPPANYRAVLDDIADHFDWIASTQAGAQARAVGFVKSQALQYAASSLRAGFAYLLRRLIRYYPHTTARSEVQEWAHRLVPYRGSSDNAAQLLERWRRELPTRVDEGEAELLGTLTDDYADLTDVSGEEPRLISLLHAFDTLFDDPQAGAKFTALAEKVRSANEPIVVFSQSVDTVYEIASILERAGVEVYRLSGDMGYDARADAIQGFRRSPNPRRVLVSSAAGGVGINLQVARWVIHADLPWNPMALEQRVGRVHRIGSTKTILVDTILLEGSREAEVFARITSRLETIVSDLSADPTEREALFRRILASMDPDRLREIFAGSVELDEVGAAVDAGRRAVEQVDSDLTALTAVTGERRGHAETTHLLSFLRNAEINLDPVRREVFAVVVEGDDGELRPQEQWAEFLQVDDFDEPLVFDRTAASYLGLRRQQTGGIGHAAVDPILRSAADIQPEIDKARSSTWLLRRGPLPDGMSSGDIVLIEAEATYTGESYANLRLVARAWNVGGVRDLSDEVLLDLLWGDDWAPSRKVGDVTSEAVVPAFAEADRRRTSPSNVIRWPLAAIGIRDS
jgi:hypothetical protein